MSEQPVVDSIVGRVDHLVYATPDVDRTCAVLEMRFGVRLSGGGRHVGRGTRNMLIAIGPACYLEVVGPDLTQPTPAAPRWFGIDALREPRLAAWAANATDLPHFADDMARRGVRLGSVEVGRRERPDGVELTWQFTDPTVVVGDGLVPFFIDWGSSAHPAATAARGPRLIDLHGEHPDPERVQGVLRAVGISMRVERATAPSLVATLETHSGPRELR